MKTIIPVLLFVTFLIFAPGCKEITEDIIDCSAESALLKISYSIDSVNQKLVHFEFEDYNTHGDFTLDNKIDWEFGDGVTITSNSLKTDHTYSSSGSYKVVAAYVLRKGSTTCSGSKEKI